MIYISGPIAGTDDYLARFSDAEDEIHEDMELQYDDIINPAEILERLPVYMLEYKDITRLCMCLLDMCDSIYMLDGWGKSRGSILEYDYAVANNYKIYRQK